MNRRSFLTGLIAATAAPVAMPALARMSSVDEWMTLGAWDETGWHSIDVFANGISLGEPERSVSIGCHVRRQINEWARCDGTDWWRDIDVDFIETDGTGA